MPVYLDIEQGSQEWLDARRGIPTASMFHALITPTGKASTGAAPNTYMAKLIAGKIETPESFSNEWTERGHELEPEARNLYQFVKGSEVIETGIVFKDEAREVSCSPDGLVGEDGGIEIKSLALHNHILSILNDCVPKEHIMQCHGNMWVTGRLWWDFVGYHPSCKPLILRVERDEKIMQTMDEVIPQFIETLNEKTKLILN